jgi:MYXO-CTERM domain-containing protein
VAGLAASIGVASACGGEGAAPAGGAGELTASAAAAIQAGTADTTHLFAVGVAQTGSAGLSVCSGVLLERNLVATARHCVTQLSSLTFDCASSTYGPTLPVTRLFVTTDPHMTPNSAFTTVARVIVPTGPGQDRICGDDIALLVLGSSIVLPQYVQPTLAPPMTDASYSTSVTAIGYGIDTPTDEAGVSAGVRRIKEDIPLFCIPGGTAVPDCFSNQAWEQAITSAEFVSGDASTCEGDSGSGAYDQASFTAGHWTAFGVLSRGAVSADGKTCIQPVYTRFDAWASLIQQAALEAAAAGGYSAPSWATAALPAVPDAPAPPATPRDAGGIALPGPGGAPPAGDDGGCAACASGDGATPGVSALASASPSSGGCAVATAGDRPQAPWALAACAIGAVVRLRRRRRS